jgi:hypothetical protein
MDRQRQDPNYQMHEDKRPTRERGGPRTDAAGQEDRGERPDDSFMEVNQRINQGRRDPEEVREEEREHDSPSAPESGTSA